MGLVPIFLQVEGKPCLVVGGGEVALRKIQPLLDAGALVTVISPEISAGLERIAKSGRIAVERRGYRDGDMRGCYLVYAATDDSELQRHLFEEARHRKILINVADAPEFCSFFAPSAIRRGQLQIAISTGGASPAMARMLRERIEEWLGDEVEVLLEVMEAARRWLKCHEPDRSSRAQKLNALAASGLGDALRRCDAAAVDRLVGQCLGGGVRLADLGLPSAAIQIGNAQRDA
jgi:precorrin-2 dehydrogenase / sirohydrochlorin ferrochelatase